MRPTTVIKIIRVLLVAALTGVLGGTAVVIYAFLSATDAVVQEQAAIPPLPAHSSAPSQMGASVQTPITLSLPTSSLTLSATPSLPTAHVEPSLMRVQPSPVVNDALIVQPVRIVPKIAPIIKTNLPILDAIRIPGLDLARPIVPVTFDTETGWFVPTHKVGHHDGSGQPGDATNIVLNGHVSGNDPVFNRLNELQPGAEIVLYRGDIAYTYAVSDTTRVQVVAVPSEQVAREAERFLMPTANEVVTLITCWPPRGPNAFDQRLIVRAVPVEP